MTYFSTSLILGLIVSSLFPAMAQEKRETGRERTDQVQESTKRRDRKKEQTPSEREGRRFQQPTRTGSTTEQVSNLPPIPASQKEVPPKQVRQEVRGRHDCKTIFNTVQEGLSNGNIANFARHFGSQVSVNLRGGERGNYSGNQAYYILENYLRSRKVVYIDFSKFDESDANPYATGSVAFNVKGNRELAQVYVSLSSVEERWVITQINIY